MVGGFVPRPPISCGSRGGFSGSRGGPKGEVKSDFSIENWKSMMRLPDSFSNHRRFLDVFNYPTTPQWVFYTPLLSIYQKIKSGFIGMDRETKKP
jgi:hypothetical protein